jgi:hypothetical protein
MEIIVTGTVGSENWLVKVFAKQYVVSCRDYQIMRGQRPTASFARMSADTSSMSQAKRTMQALLHRGYNPLLVIKFMFRRAHGMHLANPPKMKDLLGCTANPLTLYEEAAIEAANLLACDRNCLRQVAASAHFLFEGQPTHLELLQMAEAKMASSVMRASILWQVSGGTKVSKKLYQKAIAEYLACPEVYEDLDIPFVMEKLLRLIDYRRFTRRIT